MTKLDIPTHIGTGHPEQGQDHWAVWLTQDGPCWVEHGYMAATRWDRTTGLVAGQHVTFIHRVDQVRETTQQDKTAWLQEQIQSTERQRNQLQQDRRAIQQQIDSMDESIMLSDRLLLLLQESLSAFEQ